MLLLNACVTNSAKSDPSPASTCQAAENELCPNQKFLDEYGYWQALGDKLNDFWRSDKGREIQGEQDQLNGMAQRLSSEFPPGYQYDGNRKKFIRVQQSPQPQTAAPAPAAPPAPDKGAKK